MAGNPVAHLPGQIESGAIVLEDIDDAQALFVVIESTRDEIAQDAFSSVTERSVSEVVAERDRLCEFLIEAQHLRDAARDLRHLERVRQARPIMVAGGREKPLCLVL